MSRFELSLAPKPKRLSLKDGVFDIKPKRFIKLEAENSQSLIPAAKKIGLDWEITASPKASKSDVGIVIRLNESSEIPAEGYKLSIKPQIIEISASAASGAFYAACTLSQIIRQSNKTNLPCLSISDSPDFPVRGVMLDISRDKVPTMETLYYLIDKLAEWKINQFQLYTEHTFAYHAHPIVWKDADPMTPEQILEIDAYCKDHFIELVPNQNCFGHMERWLKRDKYRSMAESPNGCETAWGFMSPFSLAPVDKRSIPFVKGLFDELLPHFTSQQFNVGLDETVDLGCGRSKEVCEKRGTGRVYLDFLLDVYRMVNEKNLTMQFWGDIIIKHPELIPELPKDLIALEWGYEASHPFKENTAKFADSGIRFYVCPGTSSWNSLVGRTDNMIGNISIAAKNGLKQGAIGLLNTDWGDNGHWQTLSVSYLGFMVGAMASWNAKADINDNLAENLSINAFGDMTGKMGKAFYDLGNLYSIFNKKTFNSTIPWQMLFRELDDPKWAEGIDVSEFDQMEKSIEQIEAEAKGGKMKSPDAAVVREEFKHLLRLMRLSVDAGRIRLGRQKPKNLKSKVESVKKSHQDIWLFRNRQGGLSDSLAKIKAE